MDRKKRRRSVRNLRRQSIHSFSEDPETDLPCVVDDSLMMTISDADNSVFGMVWVETQEESLKEKRKRRRSSMLLQKPLLQFDANSLEIEAMRTDITEKSPALISISPDIIKSLTPTLTTPVQTPCSLSPSNFDVAFLGVGDTSMKKVYPVTPDVENDILCDVSPYVNARNHELDSPAKKVYPVTPDVDEDVLALGSPLASDSPFVTPLTSRKNYPNDSAIEDRTPTRNMATDNSIKLSDSHTSPDVNKSLDNQLSMNEQTETRLSSPCNNSPQFEPVIETTGADNSSEDKPVVKNSPVSINNHQLLPSNPLNSSTNSDNPGHTQGNHDNKGVDFTDTHSEAEKQSESSESNVKKLISPTGIADSLDSIATGAMGLFNTLVHKISIKRGKSQKKTPKRLKSDKNSENISHNESSEKSQYLSRISFMQESCRSKDDGKTEVISTEVMDLAEVVEGDDMSMDTGDNLTSNLPSDRENIQISSDNSMETQDRDGDNFNMSSLAESIDSQKENIMKTKRRSRRRSEECFIDSDGKDGTTNEENEESNKRTEEEESGARRSRRQRRASLDIYRSGMDYQSQEPPAELFNSQFVKFTRPKKKVSENLEDLYMNKNYKAPVEKTWETIYESPGKTKQPNQIMSKKRMRRVIDFDGFAPAKFKRRLQKATNNGWDITAKKHKILNDDFVKNKLSEVYIYLDNS